MNTIHFCQRLYWEDKLIVEESEFRLDSNNEDIELFREIEIRSLSTSYDGKICYGHIFDLMTFKNDKYVSSKKVNIRLSCSDPSEQDIRNLPTLQQVEPHLEAIHELQEKCQKYTTYFNQLLNQK
jgi:hypothetical protein